MMNIQSVDGLLLSPCQWGIRSRVFTLLRLTRPLGTFRRPHLVKPGSRGILSRSRVSNLALVTCYLSPLHSQVKGQYHASVCGSRSHALIPTGARSRSIALPKPIIISVLKPHCWKGSTSKPYVKVLPHTTPLGMG
ncbi:hypothetical protein E5676_scaffold194G001120 [Cucumis melo var. makuwa]|uniref:Uncharacterized protein n=1 Tax=Cucumis melo var. makuwa TaxID=1194695 RepID=A0A5A7SRQ2_CUCMM|nr:hypothetical protein E6C27_scaffold848G00720 [Cucumis melo var. makuwa]TYJ97309.1 hypothetical protein E5676_scaffold194G001120 [Cucumis melo var. makuwa]